MQVNNKLEFFCFKPGSKFLQTSFEAVEMVNIGIGLQHTHILFFRAVMNFNTGNLHFQATDYRRCEHNITNGTKPYDEDLFHFRVFLQT